MLQLSGNFWDYFVVFGAGVLVSFTPCVYPVMPLTASFIAGMNTTGTKWRGFFLSLLYVLGLAITYSALAILASLSGKIFGQIQNNPFIFIGVANIFLFFSLVMFDVIPLPALNFNLQNRKKIGSLWMVIFFGMASGLVVGPCTAPVLGSLLVYAATKENIGHAASLLFVFAYGVGASLILVGTFTGLLSRLPKSGRWLVRIKQFCGLVLLIAAEYYLIKAGQLLL